MEISIPPTPTSICYVRLVLYCLRRLANGHARVFRIWRRTLLGFLSFPSRQPPPTLSRVARCPCLGWSHYASMCLSVCIFIFPFPFVTPLTFFSSSGFRFSLISKSVVTVLGAPVPVESRCICLFVTVSFSSNFSHLCVLFSGDSICKIIAFFLSVKL